MKNPKGTLLRINAEKITLDIRLYIISSNLVCISDKISLTLTLEV